MCIRDRAAVALASAAPWLLAGMLALGLLGTAMTQGLLALSARCV